MSTHVMKVYLLKHERKKKGSESNTLKQGSPSDGGSCTVANMNSGTGRFWE